MHPPRIHIAKRYERVVRALLGAADTTVSSGPFVEMTASDGKGIGSVIRPESRDTSMSRSRSARRRGFPWSTSRCG